MPACSLLVDVDQCGSDEDCAPSETCDDHLCVEREACSNATCAAMGANMACGRNNACVFLTSPECTRIVGPYDRDGTVILGSILPTAERWQTLGRPIEQGLELAIREINETGGIAGGRSLALVECDDAGNEAQAVTAGQHLASVVGVPIVFGPAFSSNFIQVTTRDAVPAGVMTLSPSATSPLITGLDDQGLGWRTVASDAFQAVALADLIRVRQYRRLIVLGKNDAYGNGLLAGVTNAIVASLGDGLYSRTYPDPSDQNVDFSQVVVTALQALPDPDAVVILGTTEAIGIMRLFESSTETSSTTRYVFADGGRLNDTLQVAAMNPSLSSRIEGTEPDHQSGALFSAFALRFQQQFGAAPGIYAVNAYDGVYLAAYGLSTYPAGAQVTGTMLAASMSKLIAGQTIDAGPNGVGPARRILQGGGTINYNGASGPLDFDLATGEAPANVALWQLERRPDNTYRFKTAGRYTITAGGSGSWSFGP